MAGSEIRERTYCVAEAELVRAVHICFYHELVFAFPFGIIDLSLFWIVDEDINVHMGTLGDSKRAIDSCALMDVLIKAFLLSWWKIKADGMYQLGDAYEQGARCQQEPHLADVMVRRVRLNVLRNS